MTTHTDDQLIQMARHVMDQSQYPDNDLVDQFFDRLGERTGMGRLQLHMRVSHLALQRHSVDTYDMQSFFSTCGFNL